MNKKELVEQYQSKMLAKLKEFVPSLKDITAPTKATLVFYLNREENITCYLKFAYVGTRQIEGTICLHSWLTGKCCTWAFLIYKDKLLGAYLKTTKEKPVYKPI